MSCENCFWCRISFDTEHLFKCKLMPQKRFDNPKLHGWFCRKHLDEREVKKNEADN